MLAPQLHLSLVMAEPATHTLNFSVSMAGLAICQCLGEAGFYLFGCDEAWQTKETKFLWFLSLAYLIIEPQPSGGGDWATTTRSRLKPTFLVEPAVSTAGNCTIGMAD